MINISLKNKKGFGMIEVIISVALAAVLILAITDLDARTFKINLSNMFELQASLYAAEAIEVAHDLEISNWNALKSASCTSSSPCHEVLSSGAWTIAGGQETLGMYKRSITIEPIRRSSCSFPNTIVETGGSICPSSGNPATLRIMSTVVWDDSLGNHVINLETYVYNLI